MVQQESYAIGRADCSQDARIVGQVDQTAERHRQEPNGHEWPEHNGDRRRPAALYHEK